MSDTPRPDTVHGGRLLITVPADRPADMTSPPPTLRQRRGSASGSVRRRIRGLRGRGSYPR
jgi:hypothetical protein